MNLKVVLVFVLFATEMAGNRRGRYVSTDDMTDQVFLVATALATDTTGQVGTLVDHEREYSVVVSEIYTNNQDIEKFISKLGYRCVYHVNGNACFSYVFALHLLSSRQSHRTHKEFLNFECAVTRYDFWH